VVLVFQQCQSPLLVLWYHQLGALRLVLDDP
jgi:hypothetical protein